MCICCTHVYLLYSYVYLLYYVCIDILTLDAGLLTRSQYPEGPATELWSLPRPAQGLNTNNNNS